MLFHYSVAQENTKHLQKEVQGNSFEVQQSPQDSPCPESISQPNVTKGMNRELNVVLRNLAAVTYLHKTEYYFCSERVSA